VAAALAGDETAFATLVERYRRELHVHCYRMLGSITDAEDLVQETLLRAWRRRDTFEGRSTYRAWLYRIATNACLDFLAHSSRRVNRLPTAAELGGSPSEVPWLQPYPDRLLNELSPRESEPDAVVVAKETIELAYLLAIQVLPPPQRAVLILRDILEWSARDTADLLSTSVASVNSSLQRAKAGLQAQRPADRAAASDSSMASEGERKLLERYMAAHERADPAAVIELLAEDVRFTMPPQPTHYLGRLDVGAFFEDAFGASAAGDFRLVPTRANRQPAAANYVRAWGDTVFRAVSLDVLRIEGVAIAEITTFEPRLFPFFGLPASL
jgi:RNA polymerase sigma-70 factor (ECF subfamily)